MSTDELVPHVRVDRAIIAIRGAKEILNYDLAELYEVETRVLIQRVKRNQSRFPDDFMSQARNLETTNLRSQNVISSLWGGRRPNHYVSRQDYLRASRVTVHLL